MSDVCYSVRHDTLYRYEGDVAHSHQQLHLTPRDSERQHCLSHRIEVIPEPSERSEYQDAFGNTVTRVELEKPHDRLEVVAEMRVRLAPLPELDLASGEPWESVRDQLRYNAQSRSVSWLEAMRFRGESPYIRIKRVFSDFAQECLIPDTSVVSVAHGVMSKVHSEFRYQPGATDIATPLMEVFSNRCGVCQDFAHLMIASLRSAGLAARYVSGYLYTRPSQPKRPRDSKAAKPSTQPAAKASGIKEAPARQSAIAKADEAPAAMVGADASHAWVAVFAPPHGWIGFDPTNNLIINQEHVALAWGRDFGDVSPLRGVILGGGSHQLSVKVAVEKTSHSAAP
ncbi:MAG TPA: transglutaminase family protein [Steroidobacteraceae bacterium]|jgi:transglutaminase-like putative cysteine protease|nr:transglutaminase family protein [Steroidobacteraceae bacterium]